MIKAFKEGLKAGFVVSAYVGGFVLSIKIIDKSCNAIKGLVKNYKEPDYLKEEFDEDKKE